MSSVTPNIRKELDDVWAAIAEASKDGQFTPGEYFKMVGEVLDAAGVLCKSIAGDDALFEQLVSETERIVRDKLVPLDIPGIPPFIENYVVDPQLPLMVRPMLMWMRTEIIKRSPAIDDQAFRT